MSRLHSKPFILGDRHGKPVRHPSSVKLDLSSSNRLAFFDKTRVHKGASSSSVLAVHTPEPDTTKERRSDRPYIQSECPSCDQARANDSNERANTKAHPAEHPMCVVIQGSSSRARPVLRFPCESFSAATIINSYSCSLMVFPTPRTIRNRSVINSEQPASEAQENSLETRVN